jgi:hypothetical protein
MKPKNSPTPEPNPAPSNFFSPDSTRRSISIWRRRIGEEKLKLVLEETVRIAKAKKFVSDKELSEAVVDTTVQEKNITYLKQTLFSPYFSDKTILVAKGIQKISTLLHRTRNKVIRLEL